MNKEIEIPEGYEARIEGNKVILESKESESEGEKIRKFLIEKFSKLGEIWPEYSTKTIIAYLEKQKDNRFAPRVLSCSAAWFDDSEEEQKEPIPDKFSGLKSLLLQYLQSAANRKDDTEIESDTDLWGRKILDYVWMCEDERQKERVADSSKTSSEWSEEEKKHLYNAIEAIKYVYDTSEGTSGFKCVEFLKALQPHWKPSKEQMAALYKAASVSPIIKENGNYLYDLYDDLRKLM